MEQAEALHEMKTFHKFYQILVGVLPMTDSKFRSVLVKNNMFSGDLKDQVAAKDTMAEKNEHFLDNKILVALKSGNAEPFETLLQVMEKFDDQNLKKIVEEMKDDLSNGRVDSDDQILKELSKNISDDSLNNGTDSDLSNSKGGSDPGEELCIELAKNMMEEYTKRRFNAAENTWPPVPVEEYTKLAFMIRTGQHSQEHVSTMSRAKSRGNVDKIMSTDDKTPFLDTSTDDEFERSLKECIQDSKCTQNIKDILKSIENNPGSMILIEGAPGLGKTILMKQIAYEWANKMVLMHAKLVLLLPLRDPKVQGIRTVKDLVDHLVDHFCDWDDEAQRISCTKYIEKVKGKNVVLLLDGFDELPLELQKRDFFAEIINFRFNKLSSSSIVITSRPHASASLRSIASSVVDILGFTTDCQKHFLESALKMKPHKLPQILEYLNSNPDISSLCFVPFNMTVLLWLYTIGASLPNSSTELYNYFILHTINRHIKLADSEAEVNDDTDIDSLPKPYKKVLLKISALCLKAMDGERLKIVFTLEEVKEAYPKIEKVPGGINCFGLLQAIEHYSSKSTTAKVTSLSFVHFSVQEFLAAYQITTLPPKKELEYIQAHFWSDLHSNVFAMYVGLTKGQRTSFKTFLSSFGSKTTFSTKILGRSLSGSNLKVMSNKLFEDDRKSLRLFQCFCEANDEEACETVAKKIHASKMITLYKNAEPLLPNNLQCLKHFLAKSLNKQWIELNLTQCSIGDIGIVNLHQLLAKTNNDITIDEILLSNNSLTVESVQKIAEIAFSCNTKVLNLSFNLIENGILLEKLISANSILQKLDLSFNKLTSDGVITFLSSLKMITHISLKVLEINMNSIDNEATKVISEFLQENTSLDVFRIYGNQFCEDSMYQIVDSLQKNSTLREIMFDTCSNELRKKLKAIEKLINNSRKEYVYLKIRFATIVITGPNPIALKMS